LPSGASSILSIGHFDNSARVSILGGDCEKVLDTLPSHIVDCAVTSPPYWKMRDYQIGTEHRDGVIGSEELPEEYVTKLVNVFRQLKRVLKPNGSLWLNIGDRYHNKDLMGMPWRVALAMKHDGWILRNDVVWHHMKGTQSSKNRLRNVYEHVFHFVQQGKYYYDYKSILVKHTKFPTVTNGRWVSATGVSGDKYRRQIVGSKRLTEVERRNALIALDEVIEKMRKGEVVDFRMTIRGQQRLLHSDSTKISGRAKELEKKGFYIINSHADGYIPSDVWSIVPEDEVRDDTSHYAAFPIELLTIPIKATCPPSGIVLDPFVGTGSTLVAAVRLGRRAVGIDISEGYLEIAKSRLREQNLLLV